MSKERSSSKWRQGFAGAVMPLIPINPVAAPIVPLTAAAAIVALEACGQSYPPAEVSDLNGGPDGYFFLRHKNGYTFILKATTLKALPDQHNAPKGTILVQLSDNEPENGGSISTNYQIAMSGDSSFKLAPGQALQAGDLKIKITPRQEDPNVVNFSSEDFYFKIDPVSD